jgi:hypothetical protein
MHIECGAYCPTARATGFGWITRRWPHRTARLAWAHPRRIEVDGPKWRLSLRSVHRDRSTRWPGTPTITPLGRCLDVEAPHQRLEESLLHRRSVPRPSAARESGMLATGQRAALSSRHRLRPTSWRAANSLAAQCSGRSLATRDDVSSLRGIHCRWRRESAAIWRNLIWWRA